MKLKLVKFPIAAVNDDLTLGKAYECKEPYPESDHYEVIDDAGDGHEVEKECFGSVVEYSGEGLPPVGTVCGIECFINGKWVLQDFDYCIDYIGYSVVVATTANTPREVERVFKGKVNFIPIKSEEDKEIEEIVNLYEDAMPVEAFAKKLYEQGYRKTK